MPRTKKTAVEPIAEAVSEKPVAEAAAVAPAEEKKEEPKKVTRKRTVKATEEKSEAAPKRGRKKAAVAAEEPVDEKKEDAPKKAPARKDVEKKTTEQVNVKIHLDGKDISVAEILEKAKAAYAAANEGVEIQTVELYVNADDHAAYYVVNGQVPENNKIAL